MNHTEEFFNQLYATEPFKCQIEMWYHFDDEAEKHVILNYTVELRYPQIEFTFT